MATSGSISTSTAFGNVSLSWSRTSYDIGANTSTISYTLSIYSSSSISSSASKSYSIVFNGVTVASGTVTIGGSGTRTLKSGSTTISHNADGTKTFSYSFSQQCDIYWGSTWVGTVTGSGSSTLDTIPRASNISSFPSFTIGNSFAVSINRASSGFTHTLQLYIGGTYVAERKGIGASTTFTLTTDEENILYANMASVTSATVTLWCLTFNGSTQIGGWTSVNNTAYVGSGIVPTFTTITHSEAVSNVSSLVGAYVQGQSQLNLAITGASGAKSSTIKSYQITFEGTNYNSSSAKSSVIQGSGTLTISATVTDTRNRTATKSVTVTVLAYSPPSISVLTTERVNQNGTSNQLGTYVKLTRTASVTSLKNGTTEKNVLKYTIKTKLRSASNWTTAKAQTTISGISLTGADNPISTSLTYAVTSSYDIMIEVADVFNTTIALGVISTGEVTMSWGRSGIGIGKVWEKGALDVGGDVYVDGRVTSKNLESSTIALTAGGNNHTYLAIYARDSTPTTRSGWVGYGGAGVTTMSITNEISGGDISINPASGGQAIINSTMRTKGIMITEKYEAGWSSWNIALKIANGSHGAIINDVGGVGIGLHSNKSFYIGNWIDQKYFLEVDAGKFFINTVHGGFKVRTPYGDSLVGWDDGTNVGWSYGGQGYLKWQRGNGRFECRNYADTAWVNMGALGWYTASSKKWKKNVRKMEKSGLAILKSAEVANYEHIDGVGDAGLLKTGLIAEQAPKDILSPDGEMIDLYAMLSVAWKSIQELSEQVEYLEKKMKNR